jgi:hypothetical protein
VGICHEVERRCGEEEEAKEREEGNPGAGEDGERDWVGSLKWEEGKIWKLVEDGQVMVDKERKGKGDGVKGYQMYAGEGVDPGGAFGFGGESVDPDTP